MRIKLLPILFIGLLIGAIGAIGGYFFATSRTSDNPHIRTSDNPHIETSEDQTWTCSMHPQIRQEEPGQCPICGMDLIPLAGNTSDDPLVLEMTEEAVKLANVQTTIVGLKGKAEKSVLLNGKIQADERLSASQVAHIPGRIEHLYVTFTGEWMKKGQKLLRVYSPELVTAQQELLQALKFKDINTSLLEAARNKLRYWKIPATAIEEIEKSGEIKKTFTLYADAGGVVVNRKVAVGDYVKVGQVLFDIINLSKLWVLFDAYEEDLANIRIGDRVEFTTPALPDKVFSTRITYIDPVINPQTRVASLRTELSNRAGLLKPEMFVKGEIKSRLSAKEELMVPKSAVLWTGTRSVVYVKVPDMAVPSFEYREVALGDALGDSYLITEGLEPGEEVVTNGNFAIDAAAQLNNQQSMMNKVVKVKGAAARDYPDYSAATPAVFKQQLGTLVKAYIALKEAFVATDGLAASGAAGAFLNQLGKVDMSLLKGDGHMFWMDQLKGLKGYAGKIGELQEVEAQRTEFGFLSAVLIKTATVFGIEGDDFYVLHCPMAFDNEGADWISLEEDVRNPYFGDKMIKCGTLTGTLPLKINAAPWEKPPPQLFHKH